MNRIAFIGAGNMGGAIISGILSSRLLPPFDILVYDKLHNLSLEKAGVSYLSLEDAIALADTVVLAVKPNVLDDVLRSITAVGGYENKLYMSIAAGRTIASMEAILGNARIIRLMPNICLKAKEGMTVGCTGTYCSDEDFAAAELVFGSVGKLIRTKEELIDACTAINGSGPAYVFMFMEALADAAVKHGIDRQTAYTLCAQTVLGSAALMLQSGSHPGELKDMVCSPGGTTIEAVAALEDGGLRNAVIKAVDACYKKASDMK